MFPDFWFVLKNITNLTYHIKQLDSFLQSEAKDDIEVLMQR